MARGGRRKPNDPAPVSGPGALSRRTDGGPAQPIRQAPGGTPGVQNPNLPALQQAAPLSAGGPPSPAPSSAAPPADNPLEGGIFGPTQMPNQPASAGTMSPADHIQADPTALTRVLYALYPHPDIARLLDPSSAP